MPRSKAFRRMIESISNYSPRFKPPSYNEIKVKYLKEEVKATKDAILWRFIGLYGRKQVAQWLDR